MRDMKMKMRDESIYAKDCYGPQKEQLLVLSVEICENVRNIA